MHRSAGPVLTHSACGSRAPHAKSVGSSHTPTGPQVVRQVGAAVTGCAPQIMPGAQPTSTHDQPKHHSTSPLVSSPVSPVSLVVAGSAVPVSLVVAGSAVPVSLVVAG